MIRITPSIIQAGTGGESPLSHAYFEILHGAMFKFGILENHRRAAAFLANIGVESDGLKARRENMNYSAEGLARVWPKRFRDSDGKPNALAFSLQRKPEAIANNVYANRMGNGNEQSGDGWKYRGVGWIQTTGKNNIQETLKALGLPIDSDPSVLEYPEYAALSAAYFWKKNGCNELADQDAFSLSVKKVNGAMPCEANHGELRKARYRAAIAEIKRENGIK